MERKPRERLPPKQEVASSSLAGSTTPKVAKPSVIYTSRLLQPRGITLSKEKVQDDKILLRLPSTLTAAVDQVIKEQLPTLNRSEFIRRAVRFTLDNIEQFKTSEAATIAENQDVESVAKVNAVRDSYKQLFDYKEQLLREPQTPIVQKQIAFLIFLIGEMIFKMNE